MTRLKLTGVPPTDLRVQYRMHPHISYSVSRQFYNGELIDHSSVRNRPADGVWEDFVRRYFPRNMHGNHSIFFSIRPGRLYQTVGGGSKVNVAHLYVAVQIVANLKARGATDGDIGIFTTYAAQLRLHRQMPQAGTIKMSTIDGAQGNGFNYVVLDLVTPGGPAHSLGVVADRKRSCVGLSRAKSGLIILGNMRMDEVRYPNFGCQAWRQIIDHHRVQNALMDHEVPARHIQAGKNHFGLRGNQYRAIEPQGGL